MKQSKDRSPMRHILRGKNGRLVWGGNVHPRGGKLLVALFSLFAVLFALVAAGAFAVKMGLSKLERDMKEHPAKAKLFFTALDMLNRVAGRVAQDTDE